MQNKKLLRNNKWRIRIRDEQLNCFKVHVSYHQKLTVFIVHQRPESNDLLAEDIAWRLKLDQTFRPSNEFFETIPLSSSDVVLFGLCKREAHSWKCARPLKNKQRATTVVMLGREQEIAPRIRCA